MPDVVIPTIPQYPEQGIQAELDLIYLWNPSVANELIARLNELLENLPDYSTVMSYKGSVATVADLPATAKIGDVYNITETDENFCWTGATWDNLGSIVDLTPYRTSADQDVIDQGLQDQIDLKANASSVYTKSETDGLLAAKQDVINDLQTIRSGAFAGATAVQPAEISDMETRTHAANTYATQTTVSGLAEDVSGIEELIPEQATASNQLADKEFVNSSIATNTAYFIGTFRNVSALQAYSEPVTNNDYAFVTNDVVTDNGNDWATFADLDAYNKSLLTMFDYAWVVNGTKFDLYRFEVISQTWVKRATAIDKESVTLNPVFNRYKATVSGGTTTWGYEYTLNNSSFTADQWTAINSGITPEGVSLIGTALQPGDDVSSLVNDAGYLTTHQSLADLGITATANELNVLDGITADTTELNYVDGVTGNIQTQLNAKQATLVSGTNIKTVNGTSLLGSGDLTISPLPSQTGQSGKFLTTDGTDASWATINALQNTATGSNSLTILGTATTNVRACNIGTDSTAGIDSVAIGYGAVAYGKIFAGYNHIAIGSRARATGNDSIAIGGQMSGGSWNSGSYSIAIGAYAITTGENAIQLGSTGSNTTNSDANTFKVGNANGNFELMSADGTIPEARLADTTNVSTGDVLQLDSNGNAVWAPVSGLPDQTGQSGKYLTTDGTDASWATINALQNTATGNSSMTIGGIATSSGYSVNIGLESSVASEGVAIGYHAQSASYSGCVTIGRYSSCRASNAIALGNYAEARGQYSVAIGCEAQTTARYAIQISSKSGYTNADENTFKVGNNNGNFEIMSADGTIPEARLADTTNAAQGMVLTLDSNLNAVWQAGGSSGGISDVTVNGTSVVSGGVAVITCATIDDTSTSSQTATWSASKLNTTIGNIESLLAAI